LFERPTLLSPELLISRIFVKALSRINSRIMGTKSRATAYQTRSRKPEATKESNFASPKKKVRTIRVMAEQSPIINMRPYLSTREESWFLRITSIRRLISQYLVMNTVCTIKLRYQAKESISVAASQATKPLSFALPVEGICGNSLLQNVLASNRRMIPPTV